MRDQKEPVSDLTLNINGVEHSFWVLNEFEDVPEGAFPTDTRYPGYTLAYRKEQSDDESTESRGSETSSDWTLTACRDSRRELLS